MDWILPALALVCIIEGIGPLLIPNRWRLYLLAISQQPTSQIRRLGGALVVVGLVSLFYLLRR